MPQLELETSPVYDGALLGSETSTLIVAQLKALDAAGSSAEKACRSRIGLRAYACTVAFHV